VAAHSNGCVPERGAGGLAERYWTAPGSKTIALVPVVPRAGRHAAWCAQVSEFGGCAVRPRRAPEDPVLVLDAVPERHVRHVVHERRDADDARFLVADRDAGRWIELEVAVHGVDHPLRHEERTDRVVEARVQGTREHEVRRPELFDAAQPLHLGRVEDAHLLVRQVHVAVHGVADHAEAAGGHGGRGG